MQTAREPARVVTGQSTCSTVNQLVQSSSSEAVSLDNLKTMEMQLSGLRDVLPDQGELTDHISSKIGQLRNMNDGSCKPSRLELLYSIVEMLESLDVSSLIFKKLRVGTALSNGNHFSGVPHCEILLAALIAMAKTSPLTLPEDVQQELSVSHIISTFLSYPSDILQNAGHVLDMSKESPNHPALYVCRC